MEFVSTVNMVAGLAGHPILERAWPVMGVVAIRKVISDITMITLRTFVPCIGNKKELKSL